MNEKNTSRELAVLPENEMKKFKSKPVLVGLAVVFAAILIMSAALFKPPVPSNGVEAEPLATGLTNAEPSNDALLDGEQYTPLFSSQHFSQQNSLVEVVRFVSQSVVRIKAVSPNRTSPFSGENISGSGSGVIFHEDADSIYIATNHHVIQGSARVTIGMDDAGEAAARYAGADMQWDLAVLRVTKDDLRNAGIDHYSIAALGDSDKVEVGETVIAAGNMLGEGITVTNGIISAKNRVINLENATLTVLQTNAAINQGNSGGPLANMSGEIIGINVAKLSRPGIEGMGYSIPINDAKIILDAILQNQTMALEPAPSDRPQLGVMGITITYEMMVAYDFPAQGVYIVDTLEGGSARNAGLRSEDIIIGFESKRITTVEELALEMQNCSLGDTVRIYVYRGGSAAPMLIRATIMGTDNGIR